MTITEIDWTSIMVIIAVIIAAIALLRQGSGNGHE